MIGNEVNITTSQRVAIYLTTARQPTDIAKFILLAREEASASSSEMNFFLILNKLLEVFGTI